jgi:transposase
MAAKTMGRPRARLVLTPEERDELRRFARSRAGAAAMSRRAAIILKCETGSTDIDVAEDLHTTRETVGKWRRRFEKSRIAGLLDEPRVGAPRKITDEHVERVIRLTLHTKPRKATHWSRRLLARESGFSKDAIGRIWRTFGLQPHRSETFSLSTDPQFIEKVRDIVGLYMSPPNNALVLCVDEKSQMQALDRSQPVLPMQFTTPDRRTHNYIRHGTTSLFAALDIATGNVIGKCFRRHRTSEFVQFLDQIDRSVPGPRPLRVDQVSRPDPRGAVAILPRLERRSTAETLRRFFCATPLVHRPRSSCTKSSHVIHWFRTSGNGGDDGDDGTASTAVVDQRG